MDESSASRLDQISHSLGSMSIESVQDDDVSGTQLARQTLLDVGLKRPCGHRTVQHHRRHDAFERERRRHRDVIAPIFRHRIHRPIPDRGPRVGAGHREMDARFVDEEEARRTGNDALAKETLPLVLDVRSLDFGGVEAFFFESSPSR
jgi:hypothetical protein